jgi:iron complex outermembrane recepter protein
MAGGEGPRPNIGFAPDERRSANFVHAELTVTDTVSAFAEAGYSYAYTRSGNEVSAQSGAFAATIYSANPYIPASIQNQMTAGGIKSFTLGRYTQEFDLIEIELKTRVFRQAAGLKGETLFGADNWGWDVSVSNGRTSQYAPQNNLPITPNYFSAADVVVHPTTGNFVCRSNFYDAAGNFVAGGTGTSPGCVPMNLFGEGSITKEAENYVSGDSWKRLVLNQRVYQLNVSGDLGERLQLGAGPIGVATGFEYHTESAAQTTDDLSPISILATNKDVVGVRGIPSARIGNGVGPYRFYNPKPFGGDFNVKEAFLEFGVPILKDLSFARSLSAQLAARYTDYSFSGKVTTWKSGLDYQVIDDMRLRGTVSRDIRAPTLLDLYNSSTQSNNTNPFPCATCSTVTIAGGTGVITTPTLVVSSIGNLDLVPEKALTVTYGTVLTPTFMPGLQLSADYYRIKIDGAINAAGTSTILTNCYQDGFTSFCPQAVYTPPPGGVPRSLANPGSLVIFNRSINYNTSVVSGLDLEANYKTELFGNPLGLHFLANHVMSDYSQAPNAASISTLGTDSSPNWRLNASVQYSVNGWGFQFTERYISPSLMSTTLLEGVGTDENNIGSYMLSDLNVTYDLSNSFESMGSGNQLYLTVNNLFNRQPPVDLGPPTTFSQPTNRSVYDGIGQFFNMGVRFKF